jgi:hypothetical protein
MVVLAAAVFTAVRVELVYLVKVTTAALEIAMAVITPVVEAVERVQWAGMQAEARQATAATVQRPQFQVLASLTQAAAAVQVAILAHQQAVQVVAALAMAREVAQQELQTLAAVAAAAVRVAQVEQAALA